MKNNTIIYILAFMLVLLSFGCDGSDSTGDEPVNIISIEKKRYQSLFLSKIEYSISQNESRSFKTLSEINDKGSIVPVKLTTDTGADVILSVTALNQNNSEILGISFDAFWKIDSEGESTDDFELVEKFTGYKDILVNMSTGKIYDVTGYDTTSYCFLSDGILYTNKEKVIYKISLSAIDQAVPLNNADNNPAFALAHFILDDKIFSNGTAFDINGSSPPQRIEPAFISESPFSATLDVMSSGVTVVGSNDGVILDNAGNLWGYRRGEAGKFGVYRMSLDDEGQTVIEDYYEVTTGGTGSRNQKFFLSNYDIFGGHILIGDEGYVIVKRKTDSGIDIISGELTLELKYQWDPVFKDMKLYWIDPIEKEILSLDIERDTLSVVYEDANLISSWLKLSGNKLLFYQYSDATTVGTYALGVNENIPSHITSDDAEIESFVELDF